MSVRTVARDILQEKILSAIVEIKVPVERTEEIIRLVREVEQQIDTVVALGVGTRCDENGEEDVVAPILERLDTGWSGPRPISGWENSIRGREKGEPVSALK